MSKNYHGNCPLCSKKLKTIRGYVRCPNVAIDGSTHFNYHYDFNGFEVFIDNFIFSVNWQKNTTHIRHVTINPRREVNLIKLNFPITINDLDIEKYKKMVAFI